MQNRYSHLFAIARRAVLAALGLGLFALATPAQAAAPVESFVSDNVAKGLGILNDTALSKDQRKDKFQSFLMALCDLNAFADYTLGQYRRTASPADKSAFNAAYKDYALAVYADYFDKFNGQTLNVSGSVSPAPNDYVVKTLLNKPGEKPSVVNFRLAGKGGSFAVVDLSYEGVWLRQTQREEFTSFLGQHGGDIKALIQALKKKTELVKAKQK